MIFRKKPDTVEAIKWTGNNLEEVNKFTEGRTGAYYSDMSLYVEDITGPLLITLGEYLVKRGEETINKFNLGHFYVIDSNTFEDVFEVQEEIIYIDLEFEAIQKVKLQSELGDVCVKLAIIEEDEKTKLFSDYHIELLKKKKELTNQLKEMENGGSDK